MIILSLDSGGDWQLPPRISQGVAARWWLDGSHWTASFGPDSHTWPPRVPWAPSQRGRWAPRVEGPACQEEAALPPVTCLGGHTAPRLPPSGSDTHQRPQGKGGDMGAVLRGVGAES